MSRLGKKPIVIPEKTTVVVAEGAVTVKGPLGELARVLPTGLEVLVADGHITLTPKGGEAMQNQALWGTYVSHIKNMIAGVTTGYTKRLIVEGIGFKFDIKPTEIIFNLGFSHQVHVAIPKGIKAVNEKGVLVITGIDKEVVGSFASGIKAKKKPEPYKGKGIRYENEVIRRKEGKKSV